MKSIENDALENMRFSIQLATRMRAYEAAYQTVAKLVATESRDPVMNSMAVAVNQYFTPEEKTAFGAFLQRIHTQEPEFNLIAVSETAGLADIAVRWMEAGLMTRRNANLLSHLSEVQGRRLRYDELGGQIEAFWKVYFQPNKDHLLVQAADAYRQAGSTGQELRVLGFLGDRGTLSGPEAQRYSVLLRSAAPEKLVSVAGSNPSQEIRNTAVTVAIAGNDAALALRAVNARGAGLPAVWTKAYTALTGFNFGRTTNDITAAFQSALGPSTVGEELGRKVDRTQQLVGDLWFYYGARYGEYLALAKRSDAEDYLPSGLEGTPANGQAYFQMAEYYREAGSPDRAIEDYNHTLQFNATRGDVHSRLAEILWAQGKRDEAKSQWRLALQKYAVQQNQPRVPESFWNDVQSTLTVIGANKVLADVRPEADRLLRTYIRRNGLYRVDPLLIGALAAAPTPVEGVRWMLDMARAASDPVNFVGTIANAEWLPAAGREVVYQRLLETADMKVSQSRGESQREAMQTKRRYLLEWIDSLLNAKETQRAQAAVDGLDEATRREMQYQVIPLEIRAAAQAGSIEALLKRYTTTSPPIDLLRTTAGTLRAQGDSASAHRILEFVYTSELESPYPHPSSFLGLAEVRLESNDMAGAVALLKRMTLVAGEPFETLVPAAQLLEKFGKTKEAGEFRATRAQSAPWDSASLVAWNAPKGDQAALRTLGGSGETLYASRVDAAEALSKLRSTGAGLGSGELDVIAGNAFINPVAAERPYYWNARMRAAGQTTNNDVKIRLLRGALEIDPQSNVPRLALFEAALASRRDRLAVAAIAPMAGRQMQYEQEGGSQNRYLADGFLVESQLPGPERARVARELAGAYRKVDGLKQAILLLRISAYLDAATPTGLAALEAEQKRAAANELRRPLIAENLEQERPVRPRL